MDLQTAPTRPINSIAALRVSEVKDGSIVVEVPNTEYRLLLAAPAGFSAKRGQRIRGEIHANALRMHRSDTGGRFIEPIYGQPRIVQGEIIAIDAPARRVLMDMAVPVSVTLQPAQDLNAIAVGELWNCYVESGTRFAPIA
jgi:hypothetical protein